MGRNWLDLAAVSSASVPDLVREKGARNGERVLAGFEDGSLTYGEADEKSERIASALLSLGLRGGECAAVMLDNSREFVLASFGIAKAGLTEVPINAAQRGPGLSHIVRQSGARLVVTSAGYVEPIRGAARDAPGLETVVLAGGERPPVAPLDLVAFEELEAHGRVELPAVSFKQPSMILFTSGTTGPPKGVVRPHRADLLSALRSQEVMGYTREDRMFSVFPLSHVNAKLNTLLAAMLVDARVLLHRRFSASRFWQITRDNGITTCAFQGSMIQILWETRGPKAESANPVRTARCAPIPAAIHRPFEEHFGIELYETYGLTEIGIVTGNSDRRPGKCGRPMERYFEVRIMDEDDRLLSPGALGEIVIRPKVSYSMFAGYLGMPEATVAATRNLWFHTGDRGRLDEDGYLQFVDRVKDSIRRRGENVSAWEVEQVVNACPGVLESAAYGVASALTEEEVMVAIVRDPAGPAVSPEAIVEFCRTRLPRYAIPAHVRFVDAFPKTESQRVKKSVLRDEGITPDTWRRPD